jgi:TolA-binding protein
VTRLTCDRVALVEAMFDGRLGPSERASTERHLESCACCAELARDLNALQASLRSSSTEISPLEHQRARIALLRQSAKSPAPTRKPAALLLAALLILPLAAWAAVTKIAPLISREQAAPSAPSSAIRAPRKPALEVLPQTAPAVVQEKPATPPTPTPRRVRRAHVAQRETVPDAASLASKAFAEGMSALSRGDFGVSASKLASFAAAYPRDPRVEDAVYLEAIALERAGRLTDAQATARRYLSLYPEGAHSMQARRMAGD